MDDKPPLDLYPREWKSERPKPREPFFGDGCVMLLGAGLWFVIVYLSLSYLRSWLGF